MKLDSSGYRVWQSVYGMGNGSYDEAHAVYQTHDDGYVIAGTGFGEFWAMKLAAAAVSSGSGRSIARNPDEANAIQQTYDGGIIVAGNSDSDIWIMKLNNADGQYLWQKTYDLSFTDNAYAIQQTADGGFIVAGGYFEGYALLQQPYSDTEA